MNNIPSAVNFLEGKSNLYTAYAVKNKQGDFSAVIDIESASKAMIEFAKRHVKAALEAAA